METVTEITEEELLAELGEARIAAMESVFEFKPQLKDDEFTAGQVASHYDISRATANKRLRKKFNDGILERRLLKEGRSQYYAFRIATTAPPTTPQ